MICNTVKKIKSAVLLLAAVVVITGMHVPVLSRAAVTMVSYRSYVQKEGWQRAVSDGRTSGTLGKSLRIEAFSAKLSVPEQGGISYRVYLQSKGWCTWQRDGSVSGLRGSGLRVEALQIKLYGEVAEKYDVYYRTYLERYGWLSWTKSGEISGSAGLKKRVEGIQIRLVEKGQGFSTATAGNSLNESFITKNTIQEKLANSYVIYDSFVSGAGWQPYKAWGDTSGTTEESTAMEGFLVKLCDSLPGSCVSYKTKLKLIGWQEGRKRNGEVSGAPGYGLPIEAIEMRLEGDIADYYDIYYRVYVNDHGWLDWARNGEAAGKEGFGNEQVEAVQVHLLKKGSNAPGPVDRPYLKYVDPKIAARINYPQASAVLDSVGWDLRSAYNWCLNLKYRSMTTDPGNGVRFFANHGFTYGYGNCYVFSSTFCEMARALDYDAHVVSGRIWRLSVPGTTSPHSWVEIDNYNGGTYVFDPEFQYERNRNGYEFYYGCPGTLKYFDYYRIN